VAGAYTNSWKGTKATGLYNIDAATSSLVMPAPPNDGVLNTVGPLGMTISGPVAFNIVSAGEDRNDAWLATGVLYPVDLKNGKATMAGKIEGLSGTLTDIALGRLTIVLGGLPSRGLPPAGPRFAIDLAVGSTMIPSVAAHDAAARASWAPR
jgi:hypothetical protein